MESFPDDGLGKVLTKELLQAFESSGETREDFNLLHLCDEDPATWGSAGSHERHKVQKRWDKLKQKSIDKYVCHKQKAFPGVILGKIIQDKLAAA